METGDKAIDFTLFGTDKDGSEKEFKLSDFEGKNVVLFFYPMDDTPVCTIEASDFNDNLGLLENAAAIIGISADDVESHKSFKAKYGFDLILLSDPEGKVMGDYGVLNEDSLDKIIAKRTTFLIDKDGIIRKVWEHVAVDGHVEEVMKELKNFSI